MKRLIVLFMVMMVLSACGSTTPLNPTLVISAASDLIPAFTEIGEQFTQQTGINVVFNFGSTGQLTQQILQGAPVDVFASAHERFIDTLADAKRIIPDTRAVYAIGRITLWTRADSPFQISAITDLSNPAITRIAIANPEHAPYGVVAKEALESAGLWDEVQAKLVFGENIAQTLQYAESGNADVAFVALSLSIPTEGRWVLLPEALHTPLIQALAVINTTQHEAEARAFALFVTSETGRDILNRYGFAMPNED